MLISLADPSDDAPELKSKLVLKEFIPPSTASTKTCDKLFPSLYIIPFLTNASTMLPYLPIGLGYPGPPFKVPVK